MANITIQNLEVESTALNQVSPGEMEKVVGGDSFSPVLFSLNIGRYIRANVVFALADLIEELF